MREMPADLIAGLEQVLERLGLDRPDAAREDPGREPQHGRAVAPARRQAPSRGG